MKRSRDSQNTTDSTAKSPLRDGLQISDKALEAAETLKFTRSEEASELQARRIEAAKQHIEEGTYKVQEIVEQIAARISPYIF